MTGSASRDVIVNVTIFLILLKIKLYCCTEQVYSAEFEMFPMNGMKTLYAVKS